MLDSVRRAIAEELIQRELEGFEYLTVVEFMGDQFPGALEEDSLAIHDLILAAEVDVTFPEPRFRHVERG